MTTEIHIKDFVETIEIKIKLIKVIDGKEYIHFHPFRKDVEPKLFNELSQAVQNSMNRQLQSLLKDIKNL